MKSWMSAVGIVVLAFLMSAVAYARLPDPVPTHWNLWGNANGFVAKPWGPFVLPAAIAATVGLLALLPRISPRGFRMDEFAGLYRGTVLGLAAFLTALHGLALASSLGMPSAMGTGFPVIAGVGAVLLGNWLPKVRRNFFMGIRTPWSLAHEEVWARTHRFGGKSFVAGGALCALAGLAGLKELAVTFLAVGALLPAVYSYFACRAYEREPNGA